MTNSDSPSKPAMPARSDFSSSPALVLFPLRFFLGFGWIRAGVEKFINREWLQGEELHSWLALHDDSAIAMMPALSAAVFDPLALPISILVMVTQPLIGLALLLGRQLRWALRWGITLNLTFMAFGEILPSAFYVIIQVALLTALNIGMIGNDPRPASRTQVVLWALLALMAAPFITTLRPEGVVDDPAMVITTVCALAAATEYLRLSGRAAATSPGIAEATSGEAREMIDLRTTTAPDPEPVRSASFSE